MQHPWPRGAASQAAARERMTAENLQISLRSAEHEAQNAAHRAQIKMVQPVDDEEIRLVVEAGDQVWGPHGTLAPNELKALAHAGDPMHLALDQRRPGQPVIGFAVGFLGWRPILHVHSHQVGVLDGHRHRGVGYALKLAQRHTCLVEGITDMRWTFDPLMRRNAVFNLRTLGARAASFHPNFYGDMSDSINVGDTTDRIEVIWDLSRPLPQRQHISSTHGVSTSATETKVRPVLIENRDDWPRVTEAEPVPGAVIEVLADYETARRQNPDQSRAWRAASRQVLSNSYARGLRIGSVDEIGYHLVRNDED